jgi:hypothetical protein
VSQGILRINEQAKTGNSFLASQVKEENKQLRVAINIAKDQAKIYKAVIQEKNDELLLIRSDARNHPKYIEMKNKSIQASRENINLKQEIKELERKLSLIKSSAYNTYAMTRG